MSVAETEAKGATPLDMPAFGIGSPLFRKDRLEARDWPWLEQQTRAFVQTYQKCVAAKT